ncbi:hypothetical protein JTB14_019794 [Gonioctena quinquepunctata]|nr:hypothetical protein JTB14_019794 [Gonioctena quinquepunctata]
MPSKSSTNPSFTLDKVDVSNCEVELKYLACFQTARIAMGKYKRKTQRQSWDENSMRQAVEEVLEGRMGYLKASREYEVPRTTIEVRVKKIKQGVLNKEDSAKKELGRHKPVFSPAQEKELVEYIL